MNDRAPNPPLSLSTLALGTAGVLILNAVLSALVPHTPPVIPFEGLVLFVVVAVVGPLYEELIFRGALWAFIGLLGKRAAAVVTAAAFLGAHAFLGDGELNPGMLLILAPSTAWFTYARYRWGLRASILSHVLHNLAVFSLQALQ